MNTRSPISTISYNTSKFLKLKLDELIDLKIISYYMFIAHEPEIDDTKPHIHLYVEPNKQLDTMFLSEYFKEVQPGFELPLGVIFWERSNYDDWILYGEHFEPYLKSKNQSREFHYLKGDFICSDSLDFDFRYNHAHLASEWAVENQLIDQLRNSSCYAYDLVINGTVSLSRASQLVALTRLRQDKFNQEMQKKLDQDKCYRNGRQNNH